MKKSPKVISEFIKSIQEDYSGIRLCQNYHSYLAKLNETEDQKIIKAVLSYHMKSDDHVNPFSPFLILEKGRSPSPNDLTETDVEKLEDAYPEISDSELKSRVADILWLKKRKPQYAHDAIEAYLDSAKNIREESWGDSQDRIERAFRFSLYLKDVGKSDLEKVIVCIRAVLTKYNLEKESYFPLKLTELLLEINYQDKAFCISVLKNCVDFFTKKNDALRLNDYLESLAKWYKKDKKKEAERDTKILIAENHVRSAKKEVTSLGKSRMLKLAISTYREAGKGAKQVEKLHKELIKIQKNIPKEMNTYEGGEIDISDSIKAATKSVSNYPKDDALIRFCLIAQPCDTKRALDYLEKQRKKFVLTALFGSIGVNKDGKTVSYSDGSMNSQNLSREELLYPDLVDHMGCYWSLCVEGLILPAKDQIVIEHEILKEDLGKFVINNPLVRKGHEDLYMDGFLFGFQGKWDLAGSILAIQVEDSIRFMLEKKGILTSGINSDFTQDEQGINHFFKNNKKDLIEIFGENIFYELKVLLIKDDKGNGYNLRNLVAHGLLTREEFHTTTVIHLWWLLFRLICAPFIKEKFSNKK